MTQNQISNETSSTRWWESYAVRYFIGFVVGSICVAYLIHDFGLDGTLRNYLAKDKEGSDGGGSLFVLAILGLGYCYVASTPISVLHFGRYSSGCFDGHARHFWFGWLAVIIYFSLRGFDTLGSGLGMDWALLLISFILTNILPISPKHRGHRFLTEPIKNFSKKYPVPLFFVQSLLWYLIIQSTASIIIGSFSKSLPQETKAMWIFSAPVFWIGISQYFVLFRLLTEEKDINNFYTKLFHARRQIAAKDVRDTYTHLREHSNSVFIVVVELAVLACLLALHESTHAPYTSHPSEVYYQWAFLGLVVWMLPTVYLWGRANAFEKAFAESPEQFLGQDKTQ